jgi:hypothetical protein
MLSLIKNLFKKRTASEAAAEYVKDSAPLDPKEAATLLQEPWVTVVKTHVNVDNPRNGFFELDWNEYFIKMLRSNGYTGATDEVVDGWFQDLCREIGNEEQIIMDRRYSGYVNVSNIGGGKSEVG